MAEEHGTGQTNPNRVQLGRIVHYRPEARLGATHQDTACRAAIVIRVYDREGRDGNCALHDFPIFGQDLPLSLDGVVRHADAAPGGWHWPADCPFEAR